MLRSETLFGKRDNATPSAPASPAAPSIPLASTANGTLAVSTPTATPAVPVSGGGSLAKATSPASPSSSASNEGGSRLIVGPNIKLKGVEITDCDTLVVEGKVEATIDSRVIQITDCGSFKGSAEIDIAEIHGEFDGDLTARQKLVIYASGKVTGKVRYGKIVIEEGGQLAGDIQVGGAAGTRGIAMAKAAG